MAKSFAVLQRCLLLGVMLSAGGQAITVAGPAPFLRSAVSSPRRPAADKAQDAAWKPLDLLAFFQVKQGARIAVLQPQDAYTTRLLSLAVGPGGKVYVVNAPGGSGKAPDGAADRKKFSNVQMVAASATGLNLPEPVDQVWSVMTYHALKGPAMDGGNAPDSNALNKAVYRALKPGGHYVIVDNAATAGDVNAPVQTHRVDQLTVVNEAAAAGFLKQSEIQALRNADDPRSADADTVGGTADRFAMLLRKPDLTFGGLIHY